MSDVGSAVCMQNSNATPPQHQCVGLGNFIFCMLIIRVRRTFACCDCMTRTLAVFGLFDRGSRVMGVGCIVLKPVATCEWFWTNSSWRAPCALVRPTVMG